MQLIHDDELAVAQVGGVAFLREHHRETFRGRDKKMRRPLPELDAFRRRRVARPQVQTQFFLQSHSDDGRAKIFPDVVGERAQRRNVDALHKRGSVWSSSFRRRKSKTPRNPASVLPLPVGEVRRIDCRSRMAGTQSNCACVKSPNVS